MAGHPGGGTTESADRRHDDEARRRAQRRRTHQRRVRRRRLLVGVGALTVVLAGIFITTIRTDAIPENVSIGGVDVSGLNSEQARAKLAPIVAERLRQTVVFRSSDDPTLSLSLPGSSISGGARIDEAIETARTTRGRFGRLLSRFGIAGTREIPLRFRVSSDAIDAVVDKAEGNLGSEAVSAQVQLEGNRQITIRAAKEGRAVDRAELRGRVSELPREVDVPVRVVAPPITDATATRARDLAEAMRARAREVSYQGRTVLLNPLTITKALTFTPRGNEIIVGLRPKVVRAALSTALGIEEREPKSARWNLRGERAVLVAGVPGNHLDTEALASAIRSKPSITTLAATVLTEEPERTTEKARALKIRERISQFTTPYDCCQNRVVNIGRAARILDGIILAPGERFSLNDALGQRTAARGFVEAPAIEGGEITPTIGGGVSQVATTLFNAAYFGGLELISHTPHSFYFTRYPPGREATVSWRTPDLVFRNNWDASVLISVVTSRNALTVRLYSSTLGRRVEATTGQRSNIVNTKKIERLNSDLEPGTKKVIQGEGSPGFAISNRRKVFKSDELISDRTFYWTYQPENAIIELGPPLPDQTTTTGTTSTTTTTPTGTAPSDTDTTETP